VHFFAIAMLFLLFDVEFVFLLPWVLNFKLAGLYGFKVGFLFFLSLMIGFFYEIKVGVFQWTIKAF
jgi:NADH-quinone oxidoreductase subunit A